VTWGRGEWRSIIISDCLKLFLKSPSLPLSSSPKSSTDRVYRINWKRLTSGRTQFGKLTDHHVPLPQQLATALNPIKLK
jgi:hypothetical protein